MRSLTSSTVEISQVSASERKRLLELMYECYEGVDEERFYSDLSKKSHVILMRDSSRKIQGFSTLLVFDEHFDDEPVRVVFSGDTVISEPFWGSKALQDAFGKFCMKQALRFPKRRLFWLLLSKGFRTYLLAVNYFPLTFPKRDTQVQASRRAFRDRIASKMWGDDYDASTSILRYKVARDRVKAQLAPPDAHALQNKDVQFFLENNPGHARGDELVCLVELPASHLFVALLNVVRKSLKKAPRQKAKSAA